jgi:hypothetical protein
MPRPSRAKPPRGGTGEIRRKGGDGDGLIVLQCGLSGFSALEETMRFLMWALVGLTCVMLAGCPAKTDDSATNTPPAGDDAGGDMGGE